MIIKSFVIFLIGLTYCRLPVTHIQTPNVDALLTTTPNIIILFLKKHPMCQKIDTSYRAIMTQYTKKYNLHFYVAMYEQNPQIFQTYNIQAVPEITLYKNGKKVECDYLGLFEHTEKQLSHWIDDKFHTSLQKVEQMKQTNTNRSMIIDIGCKKQKELLQLKYKDNHNDYFCSQSAIANYTIGNIVLVTEKQNFVYPNKGSLSVWVKTYQDGYIKPLNDYYIHQIFNSNRSFFLLLTHLDEISSAVVAPYQQFARKHTNETIGFIHSHITNLQLTVQMLNFIGYTNVFPYPHVSFLTFEYDQIVKFHPQKINSQNISNWMQRAMRFEQQAFVKNSDYEVKQEPAIFSSIGHNQLLKAKQVSNPQIFVYFYSQYCEECVLRLGDLKHDLGLNKSLAAHYVKYSLTDNQIPYFVDIQSVPTLVYIGFNGSVKYLEKEHSVDNMVQFVKNNNKQIKIQQKNQQKKTKIEVKPQGSKEASHNEL